MPLSPWQMLTFGRLGTPGMTPGINGGSPMGNVPPGITSGGYPLPAQAAPAQASAAPPPVGPQWLQKFAGGFDKFANGLSGYAPNPNLSDAENQAIQKQQRAATFAQLAAGSGPAPVGTRGLLQPFGEAAMAGMQAGNGMVDDALKARLLQAQMQRAQAGPGINNIDPDSYEPSSVQKFMQSHDFNDLKPRTNTMGRYTPSNYEPDSWAQFVATGDPGVLRLKPNNVVKDMAGGGQIAVNQNDPTDSHIVVPNAEAQTQAAELARQKAQGSATGEAAGKIQGAILTRGMQAGNIEDLLDLAEPLIDEATGSGTGAGRDKLAAAFGVSTTGAQAIAALQPLQAAIMLQQPRMEGPQSDRDVELYRQAAGQIGDPSVPAETKKAALKTIRKLQEQYKTQAGGNPASATTKTQAPQAALDHLKQHPELAEQFKAKYGYLP